jgi:hypothetical protein
MARALTVTTGVLIASELRDTKQQKRSFRISAASYLAGAGFAAYGLAHAVNSSLSRQHTIAPHNVHSLVKARGKLNRFTTGALFSSAVLLVAGNL